MRSISPLRNVLLFLLVVISSFSSTVLAADDEEKPRMITPEELATKTGADGSEIWLSIMGEVYDVSAGPDFYGIGGSYSIFAAKDATVSYVTGVFTEEEAKKGLDSIDIARIQSVEHWRKFYADSEKYSFVGLLIDPRFYNADGTPSEAMEEVKQRFETYQRMKSEL